MATFEDKVKSAAESAVLKSIQAGDFFQPNYRERPTIPVEWVQEAWSLVDREAIKKALAKKLESELVDRMVNHMAAELATDIKQILSVKERREALRAVARDHFDAIMRTGLSDDDQRAA